MVWKFLLIYLISITLWFQLQFDPERSLKVDRFFSLECFVDDYSRAVRGMDVVVQGRRGNVRLPPEVNRILYVRNLPFKISSEEMYDIFGKYGAIRQIRL